MPRACSGMASATSVAKFFYAPPAPRHQPADDGGARTDAGSQVGASACRRCALMQMHSKCLSDLLPADRSDANAPRRLSRGSVQREPNQRPRSPAPPSACTAHHHHAAGRTSQRHPRHCSDEPSLAASDAPCPTAAPLCSRMCPSEAACNCQHPPRCIAILGPCRFPAADPYAVRSSRVIFTVIATSPSVTTADHASPSRSNSHSSQFISPLV